MSARTDLAQYCAGRSAWHVCEPERLVLVLGASASDAHAFVCEACADSGIADGTYADVPTPETIHEPVVLAVLGAFVWTWAQTNGGECWECGKREAGNVRTNEDVSTASVCHRCAVSIVDECHADVLARMEADEREASDYARING